jgi:hypothetical protein
MTKKKEKGKKAEIFVYQEVLKRLNMIEEAVIRVIYLREKQSSQIKTLNGAFTDLSERIVKLETEVKSQGMTIYQASSNLSHRVYSLEKKQLEGKSIELFGQCRVGDIYTVNNRKYLLAMVSNLSYQLYSSWKYEFAKVALICLNDTWIGQRWNEPIPVTCINAITPEEFKSICKGVDWQKVYQTREQSKE